MNREMWGIIKNSKAFNVNVYRRGLTSIIVSLGLSCFFGLLLFYLYLSQPERNYYATNGVTPPVQLKPLSARNMSSNALLEPDPPSVPEQKLIPQ